MIIVLNSPPVPLPRPPSQADQEALLRRSAKETQISFIVHSMKAWI